MPFLGYYVNLCKMGTIYKNVFKVIYILKLHYRVYYTRLNNYS